MGSFNNFLEREVLDRIWGNETPPSRGTLYVGLATGDPGEEGSFTDEPTGNNYARVAVTNDATQWPNAETDAGTDVTSKENAQEIEFPEATGSWGTVSHFFFADSSSAGEMLAYGPLDDPKAIGAGDTARFAPEAIQITLD
jgi:hypothetical protein